MIGRDDNHKILSEEDRRAIDALLEAGLVEDDGVENINESPESKRQMAALMLLRKLTRTQYRNLIRCWWMQPWRALPARKERGEIVWKFTLQVGASELNGRILAQWPPWL